MPKSKKAILILMAILGIGSIIVFTYFVLNASVFAGDGFDALGAILGLVVFGGISLAVLLGSLIVSYLVIHNKFVPEHTEGTPSPISHLSYVILIICLSIGQGSLAFFPHLVRKTFPDMRLELTPFIFFFCLIMPIVGIKFWPHLFTAQMSVAKKVLLAFLFFFSPLIIVLLGKYVLLESLIKSGLLVW